MFSVIKIKIGDLLEKKNVTRYRLAKDTGIGYNTLLKLENEQKKTIDFDVLQKLCDYFNCTPNEILWDKKTA